MARKTRKQKVKTSLKLTKKPETVQAVMKQSPAKPSEKKTSSIILSAEDVEEARVTKRGIIKTLILKMCIRDRTYEDLWRVEQATHLLVLRKASFR